MMFGIPGAALAMVHTCAKPGEERKLQSVLLLPQLSAAFVCGVTEPFEFGFMFLAPGTVCSLCSSAVRYLHSDHGCYLDSVQDSVILRWCDWT